MCREVEHRDLLGVGELMDHYQHGLVGRLRHIQLDAGRNAVALANRQNLREPAGERRAVLQLGGQRAVQADATGILDSDS